MCLEGRFCGSMSRPTSWWSLWQRQVRYSAGNSRNTPFQLMECDRGAQCSYHCAFVFDSCGSTQFHPTRMMSDWYDLMRRSLKATPVDETQKGWVNLSRRQATRLDQDRFSNI